MTATAAIRIPAELAQRNLYQRLVAISADVAVKATGTNAFNRNVASMSITDVERALGDLMAEHGVVTGYRWNAKPTQEGTLWLADLTVWLVNADNPDDRREDVVFDVANSPSAAVSYAIKRFYRAIFHLADEQDEQRAVSSGRPAQPRPAVVSPPAETKAQEPLTEEQKKLLIHLGNSLEHPWDKERYATEIAKRGFLGTRDFLMGAHRTQHGDCGHLADAILAGSEKT